MKKIVIGGQIHQVSGPVERLGGEYSVKLGREIGRELEKNKWKSPYLAVHTKSSTAR